MDSSPSSTKPMGELVSSNTSLSISISNNINNNNNININNINSSSSNSRVRSKEMENMSFEISKYPRDLLQRLSSRIISLDDSNIIENNEDDDVNGDGDEGGLNLGLGLSLGGKFGVDKSNKGLIRSSSIASTMPLFRDNDDDIGVIPPPIVTTMANNTTRGVSSLVRTSSLPVETEEEWRKRKEIQTLRRMEAKRRRSEKQRALKDSGVGGSGGGGGGGSGSGGEGVNVESMKFRGRLEREQQSLGITNKFIGSSMGNLFGSSTPPPPPPSNVEVKGRRTTFGSLQGFLIAQGQTQGQGQGGQQGSSQGSGESQGGGASSGTSELESKTHQASSSCGEARSPASIQSLQDRPSQEVLGTNKGDTSQRGGNGPETESSSKQPMMASENKKQEAGLSSGIEDMPCVFTIGDGPNGRKVEGILYRYGKGEQVRIMCVCHGTFLSPKDFVKHAGGRDVEHPLRHIVVSPSSSVFQ